MKKFLLHHNVRINNLFMIFLFKFFYWFVYLLILMNSVIKNLVGYRFYKKFILKKNWQLNSYKLNNFKLMVIKLLSLYDRMYKKNFSCFTRATTYAIILYVLKIPYYFGISISKHSNELKLHTYLYANQKNIVKRISGYKDIIIF